MPKRSNNRTLTQIEVKQIEELWQAGATRAEIAHEIDIQIWVFDQRRHDQLQHLPNRRGHNGGRYCRKADVNEPTAEQQAEIEQRMAEVRSSWDENTRVSRLSGVPSAVIRVADVRDAIRNL